MSEHRNAVELFNRVEIVLTKPTGERIEVDVDRNGILYIDVESNEKCKMNYAQSWMKVPNGQREYLEEILGGLAVQLSNVVEQ
ncbi:MAG: hypothetical protein MI749_04455 [Desulfovibrionales bacterium]|nr:hypothetical protein [Desulfovibrionales bacterium]